MVLNTNVRRGSATIAGLLMIIALLGVVSTPLVAAKLTRQTPTLVPPPQAAASKGHVRVDLIYTRFKPGQSVESVGFPPNLEAAGSTDMELTAQVKPPRAAGSSSIPDVFIVPIQSVPELLKTWKQAGLIQYSTKLHTPEGTNVNNTTVYGSTGTRLETMALAPTARSKVVMQMDASVSRRDGAMETRHKWSFFIDQPGAALLLHPDASGKHLEVFALLEVRAAGGDRIAP